MPVLDGTTRGVEVAPGYRISAPGLLGTATPHGARAPGTRSGGVEQATVALDEALQRAGVNDVMTIELDVRSAPGPTAAGPVRTPQGEDGLVLEVPDLGDTVGQVVLAIDEAGAVTWNFPVDQRGRVEPPTVRGAGGSKRFVIRRHVPPPSPPSAAAARGLVQALGRKVLKVLVYPVTDPILGPISAQFAAVWERSNRAYLLRWFGPDDYAQPKALALGDGDRPKLREGRSLLFLHGTFSTSHGGFAGLSRDTLEELHRGYGGRVLAFNHFTLSADPDANVSRFLEQLQLPAGASLDMDIICHSRGGLVARALAGWKWGGAQPRVRVGRIVFVGAPNRGTALADPEHMVALVDRYTSILNLAPPGPLSVVAETLEAIITVVKVVGHGFLSGLGGLSCMDPRGAYLRNLKAKANPDTQYCAVAANFEPAGGLRGLVKQVVADQVLDRVFQDAANDLVVPTDGVCADLAIPSDRVLKFPSDRGVSHSDYFSQPETTARLREWLLGAR